MTNKIDSLRTAQRGTPSPERRALRVNEACATLGINRATAYRWMKSGALPFSEIAGVRFVRVSDIEALLVPVTGAA